MEKSLQSKTWGTGHGISEKEDRRRKEPQGHRQKRQKYSKCVDTDKRPMQPAQSEQGWEDCCELRSTLVIEKLGGHGKHSRFCSK